MCASTGLSGGLWTTGWRVTLGILHRPANMPKQTGLRMQNVLSNFKVWGLTTVELVNPVADIRVPARQCMIGVRLVR
jgi:hypothetical protein